MNSDVNNNLTLSSVAPLKADSGLHTGSTVQQPAAASQDSDPITQAPAQAPTLDSVKTAADQSNKLLQAVNLSVQYSVDNSTKEVVIKVVDNQSGQLVRQIPSADMLDFVKRLQDLESKQKGAVIQTRA